MIFNITCSTDDNYLQHCVAMLCSLYENNKEQKFLVHLLVNNLSQESRNIISSLSEHYGNKAVFYNIKPEMLQNIQLNSNIKFNGKQMYSIATYYRMFLPSLLPKEIDRVLYLDCDIIVLQNVQELFELHMDGYGVAAVKDNVIYGSYHRFKMGLGLQHASFCAGMMMINLDYWRAYDAQRQLLEYAVRKWKGVYMQDQDALNYVFRDAWLQLPYKWGKTPLSVAQVDYSQKRFDIKEYVDSPCIYHYAAHVKPWLDVWFPDRSYYWKYLRLSGFSNPKKTHANKKLKMRIYKSVIRFLINKYIRPFIPDFIEIILNDIFYILMFLLNVFIPYRFKDLMLKRWCDKYGL